MQNASAGPSDPRDRYLGCLLGGAVGDALGAPVEFMSRADIVGSFGPAGITRYSAQDEGIGQITDDTQMTLFTAEGLLRSWVRGSLKGTTDIDSVTAHSYLRWLQTQGEQPPQPLMIAGEPGWLVGHHELHRRRAPGNTSLSALAAMEMLGKPARNNSKGCGGVMRVAPAGLFTATLADRDGRAGRCWWVQDVDNAPAAAFELGSRLAAMTHGHPTGHLTAGVLASMVTSLVSETGMREAIDVACGMLRQRPDHAETLRAITLAVELAETELPHAEAIAQIGQGWIAEEALAIGIYAALVAVEFEEGVVLAVNHDGDSDSTGAIAGNLLGAQFGKDAIPAHLLEPLELKEVLSEIAGDLVEFDQWDVEGDRAIWRKYPGF
ncbi:ADP-ribosylglycohydrolase family protein [Gordonia sp. WA4-43]|uniref:ADP-ribosylglycohydrolase family protein n=1 Tax=Gordonia sp. WA4-43 TaxID=2878678 RepID=UPI001CFBC6F7|nr:ADP-ribosylglycohydrolase family protein [Gordonia sp. WA4-43]UCZ92518.1 ADP-ribosylglycohydrolase family protein [Gordonia sp. WA4-43]